MGELEKELTGIKRQIWCLQKDLETICDTCGGGGGGGAAEFSRVDNYSALPSASAHVDEYYHVLNSQGTSWLPGTLGGTYYSKGFYYSNGVTWVFVGEVPYEATQLTVDAGTVTDQFVSPATLANAAQWNTKVSSVTGPAVDNTDPLNPVITIPTNLTFYATTAASPIIGYNRLVIDINDPDYDDPSVNIPIGPITTTSQLVGQLASDTGIFSGNPGTINIVTVGEIRRTAGSGTAEFYFEVYQRNNLGAETLVALSNQTLPVSNSIFEEFSASAILNNGSWLSTDRVVIKYFANRIPGGSNPSYEFRFGGLAPVRTLFPISASLLLNVPIAIGITSITDGILGNVLTVGPSGELEQLPFDSTPTNGSTNPVTSNGIYDSLALKQDSITLTTSGTGGASTLVSSTLNIPQYQSQLIFDSTPTNGSTNPVTSDGVFDALALKQNSITLTTVGTSGPSTLIGSTLNVPQYQSAITNPITGTGSSGQVSFWSGTSSQSGDNAFYWDNVNKRLGIGTTSPSATAHIIGIGSTSATISLIVQNSTTSTKLSVRDNGSVEIGKNDSGTTQSTASITVVSGDTNTGLALIPKGTGAITAAIPTGTLVGGNARGMYAVDLQTTRTFATRVASGDYSIIVGGLENTASNTTATAVGGDSNTASGIGSFVGGGLSNTASGNRSSIIGGTSNTTAGTNATVGGGSTNQASGNNSVVVGGRNNTASGVDSTIVGGQAAIANNQNTFVGGGYGGNATAVYATIVGGYNQVANGGYSFVGAGSGNQASGTNSSVVGGEANVSSGQDSCIPGGNRARAYLRGQMAMASGMFTGIGDSQTSNIRYRNSITGVSKTELFLDGTSVRAILNLPTGSTNARLWNAKIQLVAICTTQGNGTIVAGDSFIGNYAVGIKRVGSTTSLIGSGVSSSEEAWDTNMSSAVFDITADDTNEALKLEFTPPTTAGSTTVIRVVATVYLTEVGY